MSSMFGVLPPQEHTFTIDIKGSSSGSQFQGSFTYARPTLGASIEIGKTKAFITGGLPVDADTDAVADMLATLRHTLVKSPDWWSKDAAFGTKLYDLNVIVEIMKHCNEFEKNREVKTPELPRSEAPGGEKN